MLNRDFWKGQSVFLTGHTGFKGSWLLMWLAHMGAKVHGYALPPRTESIFSTCELSQFLSSNTFADIREIGTLKSAMKSAAPTVVIHMAAQALVRESYRTPVETFSANVMGTVNTLESMRECPTLGSAIVITTDKCYENREWCWSYRETDTLGGSDPYSSSKACAELVVASYRRSFFADGPSVATARAGNVIGGGDWSTDRLIPDLFRALESGNSITIRSPQATRPWQHVLEPLYGYLMLAEKLSNRQLGFDEAWNFGPTLQSSQPVSYIVDFFERRFPDIDVAFESGDQHPEASRLELDSSKAMSQLGWKPVWTIDEALDLTLDWRMAYLENRDMLAVSMKQIENYEMCIGV